MTLGPRMPTPVILVPEVTSVQVATVEPLTFPHYNVQASFVLVPDVDEVQTSYVDDVHTPGIQYILLRGRVLRQHPLTTTRPLEGTFAHEEVRREDDEILRHL